MKHAQNNQNQAPHLGQVTIFEKRGARAARGMGELSFCKAGVTKVWMMAVASSGKF
jgi:hypothetical protein